MGISINQQLISFLISVMCGAAMGIFFDCFRSIRKMIHMNDIVVNVCDGLFFLISGFFAFFTILTVNNGELRWYLFAGILCGGIIYFLLLSKWFMKAFVFLLKVFFRTIYYILKPILIIFKWIGKLFGKIGRLFRKAGQRLKIPFERIGRQFSYLKKTVQSKKTVKKKKAAEHKKNRRKKKGKKPKKSENSSCILE